MKSLEGEERRQAWLRHRAEWWARRRMGRSSEDVWDIRTCVFELLLCADIEFYRPTTVNHCRRDRKTFPRHDSFTAS